MNRINERGYTVSIQDKLGMKSSNCIVHAITGVNNEISFGLQDRVGVG